MSKSIVWFTFLSLIFIGALSWEYNNPFKKLTENLGQDIMWFDQIINHFDYMTPTQNSTWKQRYFVFDQYFDAKTGPVILYICG